MSPVWLELLLFLLLPLLRMALCDQGTNGLVRKNTGESVTIGCRTSQKQDCLNLRRGLDSEVRVLFLEGSKNMAVVDGEEKHRFVVEGTLAELDITITNLTVEDTGLYRCMYKVVDDNGSTREVIGNGSVLLVVEARLCRNPSLLENKPWLRGPMSPSHLALILSGGAILLLSLIVTFIWMISKFKAKHTTVIPRRIMTNEVYEDMRCTIER